VTRGKSERVMLAFQQFFPEPDSGGQAPGKTK